MKQERIDIKAAKETLQKEYKKLRICAFIMIAIIVAVIISSALRHFWLTGALLLAAILFQFVYFRGKQKEYQKHIAEKNLRIALCPILHADRLETSSWKNFGMQQLEEAELIPAYDRGSTVNAYAGMSGMDGDTQIESCDVSIAEPYGNGSRRAMINCGNWTRIILPKPHGCNCRILEKGVLMDRIEAGYYTGDRFAKQMPAEWNLTDDFTVYQKVGSEMMPGSKFIGCLKALAKYTPGKLAVSLHDNVIDIYIKDRFIGVSYTTQTEISEEMLRYNPFPEMEKILIMVRSM